MTNNKRQAYIVPGAIFIILLSVIFYYQFYPRYNLGYSEVRISKHTWESAYPGYDDYAASLYYKRFDNKYNYKAYLIYRYYDFISFADGHATISPLHEEVLARISRGCIEDKDEMIIDSMLHHFREMFLSELKNYHPNDKESEYVSKSLLALYFMLFYNHEGHGFPLDKREFYTVISWLKDNDKDLQAHLEDPFLWRGADFSCIINISGLRNWISLNISSEFLRDVNLYEKWIDRFRQSFAVFISCTNHFA